ncbi:MAG: molybdenum cofactor guanylyltransferase [Akkermansiaceae bacterium]|jgi:molybdopterin-guanine dinucleotide biosynthesis protein A|nr:molybdenum cofactor guanylyltransferase [Akkermansiaceae bacterium]MDP4646592.1 molybdenum cofactor guanylyltransferase [Akkermansiaceae bacterium]MDP4720209.1 molybdenum cofactor guanylyltransferase [Akkermansiaceae bacterium]MDP4779801.1 molybdenum cofactor guanylyltransferase [Akkermansiaceae bacterium]MDP4846411.1 molybdenum cofactor guanylyltransferase [Akkermansiaceae bacterium]
MAGVLKGLVLAGGKGRRMGRDKASILHADGRSFAKRTFDLLMEVGCGEVVLSLRDGQAAADDVSDLKVVRDEGDGPMGGMLAGLEISPEADWLVVACDLPELDAKTLSGLLGHEDRFVVYRSAHDGGTEPLCGFYGAGAAGVLREAMAAGERSPRRVLKANVAKVLVPENSGALKNANFPEDLSANA